MKIQKNFGFVLEEKSEVFSASLLKHLKSASEKSHEGEFPKKFQNEKIEFTFSTGARASKGKIFHLKKWVKNWGYWSKTKVIIIFEQEEEETK